MTPYLEISFRHGRPFAAYLHCQSGKAVGASHNLGNGLVLDVGEDHSIVGLEITSPSQTSTRQVCQVLAEHGLIIDEADVTPLVA